MEQDMRVDKQITEEDSDQTKPTKYKVLFKQSSITTTKSAVSNVRTIKKLTIISEDPDLFKEFPHNELVTVKVSKPQRKLA